jgi:hypothetical protein
LVDQEERLQLDRVGSTEPPSVAVQAQLQLDRVHPAVSASGAVLQLERLQLDRV